MNTLQAIIIAIIEGLTEFLSILQSHGFYSSADGNARK
jgi:undecaprenyl pyrophosphate phosphatase UppP